MVVKLKRRNTRYRDLTFDPFLYPPRLFTVVDGREPADWVSEQGEDGERYAYPPPLNTPGFFEDFFDRKARAVGTFWRVVNRRLAAAS